MRRPPILLLVLLMAPIASHADDRVTEGKETGVFLAGWEAKEPVPLPIDAFDPRKGPDDAPVTVAVFSDFQCRPYCARAAEAVEGLAGHYAGKVRFVFKHYPLNGSCNPSTTTQMHAQACAAAFAAQCAGEQGRFWAMHDALFEADLADGIYEPLAYGVGLDVPRWKQCLASERVKEQIGTHARQGGAMGVSGTPNWVINGRKGGGMAPAKLEAVIRYELDKAGAALPDLLHLAPVELPGVQHLAPVEPPE